MIPLGPSGGGGLFSTAMDYLRFCEMLLQGGQLNGVRLLAPRAVEMMRTNHVDPEPHKTMPLGTGWGMDFQIVMDAAAAGEPVSDGAFGWFGIAGTWFWIDPVRDLALRGHGPAPESRHDAAYSRIIKEPGVSGDHRLVPCPLEKVHYEATSQPTLSRFSAFNGAPNQAVTGLATLGSALPFRLGMNPDRAPPCQSIPGTAFARRGT